jgi:hypothetical protein
MPRIASTARPIRASAIAEAGVISFFINAQTRER